MALLNFKRRDTATATTASAEVEAFLDGYSIEVMPRTAEKIDDFRDLACTGLLSPTAIARTAEACRAAIAGSDGYSPASAVCGIQSWLRLTAVFHAVWRAICSLSAD